MRRVVPVAAILGGLAIASPAWADNGPPGNLGNGLARLVAPPPAKAGIRMTQAPLAIRDRQGRVLVDVYAQPQASLTAVRGEAEAAGLQTQTVDSGEKALEGFVALERRRRDREGGGRRVRVAGAQAVHERRRGDLAGRRDGAHRPRPARRSTAAASPSAR